MGPVLDVKNTVYPGIGKLRECGTEYVKNAGENAGIR